MDYTGLAISHYRVIEKSGQGGMATVYRAYDTHLERDVAIKVVQKEAIAPIDLNRILKRFEREAKSLAKFMHPNIVPVFDFGDHEGAPYLVMAYLPGGTLSQYLRARNSQPLPPKQAVEMILPIADALRYAHQRGIIHRDVKPSNILITEDGVMVLSDFGIAKRLEEDIKITQTNMLVGTPGYMAPEQWQNQVFLASDQYALGVVLFEMLTGKKPFVAETPAVMAIKQVTEPLPRFSQFGIVSPEALERVLFKALANQPEDRYAEIDVFFQALKTLDWSQVKQTSKSHRIRVNSTTRELQKPSDVNGETRDVLELDEKSEGKLEAASLSANENDRTASKEAGKRSTWSPWTIGAAGGVVLLGLMACGMVALIRNLSEVAEPQAVVVQQRNTPARTSTLSTTPTPTLGIGSTMIREKDGMAMVYVPKGTFIMGSERGFDDELPVHEVYLDAFWIDKFEVTNEQFSKFIEETGYETSVEMAGYSSVFMAGGPFEFGSVIVFDADWKHPEGPDSDTVGREDHPVVNVSWNDAQTFCEWAGGRLPTEAEWEKAARGADERVFPWGNQPVSGDLANFPGQNLDVDWADESEDDRDQFTAPVGSYPNGASPYGALDMAGNIWEWVADWYDDEYYSNSPFENPTGPAIGDARGLRGGAWRYYVASDLRSAARGGGNPYFGASTKGFRCVTKP